MRVSAKAEYACLAMLQLAHDYASGEPVQLITGTAVFRGLEVEARPGAGHETD